MRSIGAAKALFCSLFIAISGGHALNAQELPNWSGVKLELWKYSNPFFPSEWGEAKLGGYDWKAANAKILNDELNLDITEKASGQVQANDSAFREKARWEVEVTLPTMKSFSLPETFRLTSR